MRLKVTPTKEVVRSILTDRIGKEELLLSDDETALAKLNAASPIHMINQYRDSEKAGLVSSIERRTRYLKICQTELSLLDSHEAPKVLVEIEL